MQNDQTKANIQGWKFKGSLMLVSMLVGVMVTIQYSSSHRSNPIIATSELELKSQLAAELEFSTTLNSKIIELKNTISQYEKSSGDTERLRTQISDELMKVRQEAALTKLTGAGVTISLTRRNDWYNKYFLAGVDPNLLRVDTDHLTGLKDVLFASGAQGVSINNQRISSFSTIREIGPEYNKQLQVNGRTLIDPYTIDVVGNIDNINAGLLSNQIAAYFATAAFEMTITQKPASNPITLPAYDENSIEIRAAKVDTQGDKK